jgi:probable F420-dependent oxidoreductase
MRFGVHLPQYGRAASAASVRAAARQAEDLGFDDVWVYDHVVVPSSLTYPKPFAFEPLATLAFAAGATTRIGLGTSVLVLPYRNAVYLAKALASLDLLSEGRLILGVGAGWLEPEFAALGVPYDSRGVLTDEAIELFRACWEAPQPLSFEGPSVTLESVRIVPVPERHVPIWVGGGSPPALRRAVDKGDGWHGAFLPPEQVGSVTAWLRQRRPDPEFTLSMRVELDVLVVGADEVVRTVETLHAAGVQHVMLAPQQSTLDAWLASVEALAGVVAPCRDWA